MESIYTELALYGRKNECARTDTVSLTISEVCDGTVSLCNILYLIYMAQISEDGEDPKCMSNFLKLC